jgi:hypothetical protein
MKSFKDYLTESKKTYDFRVKIAGDMTTEQETLLKSSLDKFQISGFKKTGKTPIQELPLDFPQVKNCEVNIYEVVLSYPTTQNELTEYLSDSLKINKKHLVVRSPGEPTEEYQQQETPRKGALLDDTEYSEAPNAKFEDYYGDKYNSGFVKELNDILKLQRKARGEQIPTESAAKYNTDADVNTNSVMMQAPDPRK